MDTAKPRIAYLIADAQICGGVAVVCQHANRLARRGFDVCIVSTAGAERIDWFPGLRVPVHPLSRIPRGLDIGVATWWETAHDLHRMDIPRKCYFVQSDETRFYEEGRCEPIFARDTYRYGYEFFTEARWIVEWLKAEFGREARYVPNGIDLEIFHEDVPLAPRGKRPRVLIEGPADMPSKGVAEAFAAARGLGAEVWYANYRGVPDPSWRPDRYFHCVPMEEMRGIYSSCDILLKMSTVEGASGPPLEMMACGGMCVLARVTGMDEAIRDGENALVVDAGDTAGASAALKRLIGDPALRARLSAAGGETAKRLDWERSIDVLEEMFLSPPAPRGLEPGALRALVAEKESALVDAYACIKRRDQARAEEAAALWRERDDLARERNHLARERDDRAREWDELRRETEALRLDLNSIRLSKQWRIASAILDARRSPAALLRLPFRMIGIGFGRNGTRRG
jgi:glycosyltransferase involved in cell wall biosynthesis